MRTVPQFKAFIRKSCLEKTKLSEQKADDIIRVSYTLHKQYLYKYKCNFCGQFHLSKTNPEVFRNKWKEVEL